MEDRAWAGACAAGIRPQLETELQLEDILVAHPKLLDGGIELVGRQTPAAVYDEWLRYLNEPPAE